MAFLPMMIAIAVTQADAFAFMEPAMPAAAGHYRLVTDTARVAQYRAWLDNDPARRALALYQSAWHVRNQREGDADQLLPPYHIALVPGGNHADTGFTLHRGVDTIEHPALPYIKLSPDRETFGSTLLHETGHVALGVLAGERGIPAVAIAAIPHSTAALTDRGTAFNEGYAIHLETLAAHLSNDPDMRTRYRHERFVLGDDPQRAEYFRAANDLRNFAQTYARYGEVRDNAYAFAPAFRGADYLRVQLEKSRDFATLLEPNQLLQSEGFHATLFFTFTMRGDTSPTADVVAEREVQMLEIIAEMFARAAPTEDTPYLIELVETALEMDPRSGGDLVDLLLDLSHGVFADAQAAELWRACYRAALTLDVANYPPKALVEARARWRREVRDNPVILRRRLGPQIRCVVPERSVRLLALGNPAPVSFDLNTVQEGILNLVPEMTSTDVTRLLAERTIQPFASALDFQQRIGAGAPFLKHLRIAP